MCVQDILTECESRGVRVTTLDGGKIYVDPISEVPDKLRERLLAKKPDIYAFLTTKKRLHVHRVMSRLRAIRLYRDGDWLRMHKPELITDEHRQLIAEYTEDLLEALTPRGLTKCEAEQLAQWLQEIGESKEERVGTFEMANNSPADRVALLWIASGSPNYSDDRKRWSTDR